MNHDQHNAASAPAGDGFGVEYDENDGNPDYTITWPDGRWLVAFRDQRIVVGQSPQNDQVAPTSHDLAALTRPRTAVGEQSREAIKLAIASGMGEYIMPGASYDRAVDAILALQSPPAKVEE